MARLRLLATLVLAAAQVRPPLEMVDLAHACDRVIEGRVAKVTPVRALVGLKEEMVLLAELSVTRTFWGYSVGDRTVVNLGPASSAQEMPSSGSLGFWFLTRSQSIPLDHSDRVWIREATGTSCVQDIVLNGSGVFAEGGSDERSTILVPRGAFRIPAEFLSSKVPVDDGSVRIALARDQFEAWVEKAIAEDTPRVRISATGYVACAPEVRVDARGKCFFAGCDGGKAEAEKEQPLPPKEFESLLALIQSREVEELPDTVGDWCCPDMSFLAVEIRRANQIQRINLFDPPKHDATADERHAYEVACDICKAVPKARDWIAARRK